MANIDNYRKEELLVEIGFQGNSSDKTAVQTVVTPVITPTYLQTFSQDVNENVRPLKFINGGNGRNITHQIKGNHTATFNMGYWIAKDLDQATPMDVWLLKMGIDGTDTKAESTPDTYTIPDTADEYGDDYLKVMTIEAGYNKSGSITQGRMAGAIVNTMTVHCEEDQEVLVTFDGMALFSERLASFTAGSLTEASEDPFKWGDIDIEYGDASSTAAYSNVTMVEFVVNNNVRGLMDLANSSGTVRRYPTAWILGKRDITGTIRINLAVDTDNGQELWETLYNDASGTATPAETVELKDLQITLNQDATYFIRWILHDVVLGSIPENLNESEDITSVTIPFTAKAVVQTQTILGTATAPTNWSE